VPPTPRKPQGKTHYTLAPEEQEPRQHALQPGVDREARWVKKGNKLQYGYKRHYLAAEDTGLVLAVHPTAARVHDGQCMASCLDQVALPSGSRLRADKGVLFSQERSTITSKRVTQRYPTQGLQR
jgi:transposase, IS5 family